MHTEFVEACIKDLAKALFQVMDGQDLQDPEKMSALWVQNLQSFVRKMKKPESLMIGMKPKDTVKKKYLQLLKADWYPKEEVLPEDGLCKYLHD